MDKIIFHVDVNSAFLSWEAAYRLQHLGETLDLREIPAIIGGDREARKGIVLAKSLIAKQHGVQTGEPIVKALSKCPELKIIKPNYALYVQCSNALLEILRSYTPCVEQYSIDEAYMDMTGTSKLYGAPLSIANCIRKRVEEELGFTVNIGISSNKLLAKMASDFKKPNLVHTLFLHEIEEKMWPLPVGELFFVGSATLEKVHKLGIHTIGELAKADSKLLKAHLNKHGVIIHQYANGIDASNIMTQRAPHKGYGNSTTIPFDVSSVEYAQQILLSLCETVGTRLRQGSVKAGCVTVSIVDTYFEHHTKQKTLISPTHVTQELYEESCKIFDVLWNHKTPIRQLGVHTSQLSEGEVYQYNLFDQCKYDKYAKLDHAIDQIRMKYGEAAVKRAPFLNAKIDHMAGGLSKEKKTGMIY